MAARDKVSAVVSQMTIAEERLLMAICTNTPGGHASIRPNTKGLAEVFDYSTRASAASAYYVLKKKVERILKTGERVIRPKESASASDVVGVAAGASSLVENSTETSSTNEEARSPTPSTGKVADAASSLVAISHNRTVTEIVDAYLLLRLFEGRTF